jgi:hypothetical protein
MNLSDLPTILVAMLLAMAAVFFAKKTKRKEYPLKGPPKNTASKAALDAVQLTFEQEVDGIHKNLKGTDPAGDLADRGNTRSR